MIRYSEIFYSMQGEGLFTGVPTLWIRLFGCNLQCQGFGQKFPTKPETHIVPHKEFDISTVDRLEDLPVWKYGCDSSYSWSKKYKHLCHEDTAEDLVRKIEALLSPRLSYTELPHLCFTGGEPFVKHNQAQIADYLVMNDFLFSEGEVSYLPRQITFETNGTQLIDDSLRKVFVDMARDPIQFTFSVSPKLWTVSGEKNEKAIRPEVVKQYKHLSDNIYLKFVVGDQEDQWEELLRVRELYDKDIITYIMPVGATEEAQEEIAGKVADKALKYGFRVSARVHAYLWGNTLGV